MSDATNRNRVQPGTSAGGQFAVEAKAEADVQLGHEGSGLPFGDIEVKDRCATFSAVVARREDLGVEFRADVRVEHAERGYYTVSVRRRAYDSCTGRTHMAPHRLRNLSGIGDARTGRFSAKALLAAANTARERLVDLYAEGVPSVRDVLSTEVDDRDLEFALGVVGMRDLGRR